MVIVKEWTYKGRRCKITKNESLGHYCGYIRTGLKGNINHVDTQLWRLIDVHGGITYDVDEDGWVGFDCAHAGDICVNENDKATHGDEIYSRDDEKSTVWSVEDVEKEVEKLADQWTTLEDVIHRAKRFDYNE